MFDQAFKRIDDVLRKEAGCTTELDYTEQTSWLLFLKYLDGLEEDKATEAALEGKKYTFILDKPYRSAPKDKDGALDHNKALTGDDLRDFVNQKLFPYLHNFKQKASGPNTIEYKIGEIFGEIKNKIQSGYNLCEIIDHIDELRFRSQPEKHELSHLYEAKIKNMGNAGRNGGEYHTPRPLIRAIVQVVKPKIGDRIYDGAVGSAGFLCADPGRNMGKANPLNDDDLAEFVKLQKTFADSPKSWSVDIKTINKQTFDLSVKNPNGNEEITHRSPAAIMKEIAALDAESAKVLANIKALL
jgi:type I restriction-modification system DNA methylase subunit